MNLNYRITPESFLRFILGMFFILSAFGKLMNSFQLSEVIYEYGFNNSHLIISFIINLELSLGIMFIFKILYNNVLKITILLLFIFTFLFYYAYFFKGVENCGCMGSLEIYSFNGYIVFIRNTILISICIYLLYYESKKVYTTYNPNIFVLSIGLIFTATIVLFYSNLLNHPKDNYIHPFVGKMINNTPIFNHFKTSSDSTYAIFIFSRNCEACQKSIPNLNAYHEEGLADRFLGIGLNTGDTSKTDDFNFDVKYIEGKKLWDLTEYLPTLFFIVDNKIKFSVKGKLYSVQSFKSLYFKENKKNISVL